jgi:xylan 1,4-beta-xylosidase
MNDPSMFRNPILPGFYPDPSICRVGRDFYLVNSSFAYFPGIPIHHSRDLMHWKRIGNVLDRASQLPLEGSGISRGLFAPTIRYHAGASSGEGRFYVVCTNIDHGGNFIVSAEDPAGPWSEPAWLEAPGIDPSLYFEDLPDGSSRAWYCGTRGDTTDERFWGDNEIWLQELDLGTLKLKGESRAIWKGALRSCAWAEGPHLYKIGTWYYVMISEGGTGRDHAVTIARSRDIWGPYEGKKSNPILTHRHLGKDWPIVNVGHGDLIDDSSGDWWMVHLASRPIGGFSNLGRETFLSPVAWEDEWPLPCPGCGIVRESFAAPRLESFEVEPIPAYDDFDAAKLAPHWLSLRAPASDFSSLSERPGFLCMRLGAGTLRDKSAVSFVGRRQLDADFSARTVLEFGPEREGEAAGLALVQSEDFNYRLELGLEGGDAGVPIEGVVRLLRAAGGADELLAKRKLGPITSGGNLRMVLTVEGKGQKLGFRYGHAAGDSAGGLELLASEIDGTILSTEKAGGFVGTVIGMYATGGGLGSPRLAAFDGFEYCALRTSGSA